MKSVQYYAFYFQHEIDLEEYLNINYQLTFQTISGRKICTQDPTMQLGITYSYENTWVRPNSNLPITNFGISPNHGNVLTWEAITNNCSMTEAVSHVIKKSSGLTPYKTSHLNRVELFAGFVSKYFSNGRPKQILDYLDQRGIDYSQLTAEFQIGAQKTYQGLVDFFDSTPYSKDEIREILSDLFIVRRSGDKKYMQFNPSIVVPVYTKSGGFLGFHGRKISSTAISTRYFNTGFLREVATEVLYGEEKTTVQNAIFSKKQIIITKGIFDFYTCYQKGYRQVVATLNMGISFEQFDRVLKNPVSEVVVGFDEPRERDSVLGLVHQSLQKVDLSIIDDTRDVNEAVTSGADLSNLISGALKTMQASKSGLISAGLKKRKSQMDALTELGQTFIILKTDLQVLISTSKKSPKKIKDFLINKGREGRSTSSHADYIRIPKTFVVDSVLNNFNSELRTLLHLLLKTRGRQTPVNYTQGSLRADLDLSQAVLIGHLNVLKAKGYLLVKKDIRIEQLKTKRKRTVVFFYYPSTIKFS